MKDEVPEYDISRIIKLPPGEAAGADDLQTWAYRRATGRSGVPNYVTKVLRCTVCGHKHKIRVATAAQITTTQPCRRCGKDQPMKAITPRNR